MSLTLSPQILLMLGLIKSRVLEARDSLLVLIFTIRSLRIFCQTTFWASKDRISQEEPGFQLDQDTYQLAESKACKMLDIGYTPLDVTLVDTVKDLLKAENDSQLTRPVHSRGCAKQGS